MICPLEPYERPGRWKCPRCNRPTHAERTYTEPPNRGCAKPGLGDIVAAFLELCGLTKERADKVAKMAGGEGCGCGRRQERLNGLAWQLKQWLSMKLNRS